MDLLYDKGLIKRLENKIGLTFRDKALLQRAITHKSFSNENKHLNYRNNERLEFLGDSVLSIVISTYIFDNFPDYPEGELAKMRSVIVSEPILAQKARELELGQFLLLGKGEELTGGRKRDSLLANAMEALIGAIYLDLGFAVTTEFLIRLFKDIISDVEKGNYIQDFKTILQETFQQKGNERPVYRIINEIGPDHNKQFEVEIVYDEKVLGIGKGSSKKEAEQQAARTVLKKLGKL
jgi:ribonuclease-3